MVNFLYVSTSSTDDPIRATLPFLTAKRAIDTDRKAGIILMGKAAPLIKGSRAQQVQGAGLPTLKELVEVVVSHEVSISV